MSDQADKILNLENLIKGYLADISAIKEKLKSQKDMMKSTIEQDRDYSEAAAKTQEVRKKEQEVRQKLVKTGPVQVTKTKVDEIQATLKDATQALSDYLNQYAILTNSTDFMGPDGELHQIVRTAKLVKKRG